MLRRRSAADVCDPDPVRGVTTRPASGQHRHRVDLDEVAGRGQRGDPDPGAGLPELHAERRRRAGAPGDELLGRDARDREPTGEVDRVVLFEERRAGLRVAVCEGLELLCAAELGPLREKARGRRGDLERVGDDVQVPQAQDCLLYTSPSPRDS